MSKNSISRLGSMLLALLGACGGSDEGSEKVATARAPGPAAGPASVADRVESSAIAGAGGGPGTGGSMGSGGSVDTMCDVCAKADRCCAELDASHGRCVFASECAAADGSNVAVCSAFLQKASSDPTAPVPAACR